MERHEFQEHDYTTIYCSQCGKRYQILKLCDFRFCSICKISRAAKVRKRIIYIFKNYPPPPGTTIKMITLSARNCQNLELGIKHLVSSFRRLRQRKLWSKYVSGGATFLEITGKKGNFHPHIHILCYCSYFPWKQLHSLWQSCSGGRAAYIQAIPKTTALFYVLKYLTKLDMSPADQQYVSDNIKHYRLFQRFGSWHNFVIPRTRFDVPCQACGCSDYLNQWDIRKFERCFYET